MITELSRISPYGPVTNEALASLHQDLLGRYHDLESIARTDVVWNGEAGATTGLPRSGVLPAFPTAGAFPGRSAGPSIRELLTENSIQIVSYTGAFLLIVATILFEAYGTSVHQGGIRFALVAAICGLFTIAGWVCIRSERLRIVGKAYAAIASLLVPLTMTAAYVFLSLGVRGLSAWTALAAGGFACALMYGVLAGVLKSRAYTTLSLIALPVGWGALIEGLHWDVWRGAAFVPVLIPYVLLAAGSFEINRVKPGTGPGAEQSSEIEQFTSGVAEIAEVFLHLGALFALGWTYTWVQCSQNSVGTASVCGSSQSIAWPLFATLATLTCVYALYIAMSRKFAMLWAPCIGLVASALVANVALSGGIQSASVILVVLAWGTMLAAWALSSLPESARRFLRIMSGAEAVICVLLIGAIPWLNMLVLIAATAVVIAIAVDTKGPEWLVPAAMTLGAAWGWTFVTVAQSVSGSQEPRPSLTAFVEVFSALPVLLAILGVILGSRIGRKWSAVVYQLAVVSAAGVSIAGLISGDAAALGAILVVYAVFLYAIGAVERVEGLVLASALTLVAGAASLMVAAGAPYWSFALACAGISWAVYLLSYVGVGGVLEKHAADPEQHNRATALSTWQGFHRVVGIGGAVASAVYAAMPRHAWDVASPGNRAGLAVTLSMALMLAVEARARKLHVFSYLALIAASFSGFWIARILGADNPQLYVMATGVCLTVCGAVWPNDAHADRSLAPGWLMSISGSALLLVTTAVESLSVHPATFPPSIYVALLAGEGVVWIVVGIGLRSRPLIVSGAAAVGVSAAIALGHFAQKAPVYAVFGVLAAVLLAFGIVLVFLREYVGESLKSVSRSWREWS
ncbi:MAG: hypothetical protein ABSH04_08405 [Acidimicrobiales bacterium]